MFVSLINFINKHSYFIILFYSILGVLFLSLFIYIYFMCNMYFFVFTKCF